MSMERLHREAKKLASAHARGDAEAIARASAHRNDGRKPLKLAGAQAVVAGEHGFSTWQRLRAYVEREEAWGEGLEHAFRVEVPYFEERADGLLASALDGTPGAVARFEGEGQELDAAGARAVVARRHGFDTWTALKRHVVALDEDGDPFRRAYLAVESGADGSLRQLLERFPELARANGTNGNALINMATDLGCVRALLEAGADVAHANAHGWTPLHQAAYGDNVPLAELLVSFDAPTDLSARGAGGTPLVIALFWGHHAVVDVLRKHGAWPTNLRVAAGTGDVARIAELVPLAASTPPAPSPGAAGIADAATPPATVTDAAGALRGFYRPHGGFPAWAPSDDPQEILDEALSWAARSDRVEALRALVERGARLDADVYRGTALVWAAATGRVAAIRELVSLGATVDGRSTFGGPTHGEGATPLQLAAQSGHREAVELLLSLGADPTLRDALHDGDAAGWAHAGDHPELATLLSERAA